MGKQSWSAYHISRDFRNWRVGQRKKTSASLDARNLKLATRPLAREGDGTPLQYSCLENPMDGGAWWAAVHGVAKSQTRLSDFTFTVMHWRRQWQPTPAFLPGESHGQRGLVGYSPWGCRESDTNEPPHSPFLMLNCTIEFLTCFEL